MKKDKLTVYNMLMKNT